MYKMSVFSLDDWPHHKEYLIQRYNISECYYQGYQEPPPSYKAKEVWWQIMTLRLAFFISFSIICLLGEWAVNFLFFDVPEDVQIREGRDKYLAKRALYHNNAKYHDSSSEARGSKKDV